MNIKNVFSKFRGGKTKDKPSAKGGKKGGYDSKEDGQSRPAPKQQASGQDKLDELLDDKPNSLREAKPEERQAIFIRKMNLCRILFDFNAPSERMALGIEKKRVLLSELVEHISTHDWFSEEALQHLLRMIAQNLFRGLPSNPSKKHDNDMDGDDEDGFADPAWSHLHLVYECLLRFLLSPIADKKIMQKHLQGKFLLHLIELFESEDMRERDYLKTILHRIYGRFMPLRQPIRKAICHVCYRYIYDQKTFNGIAEFLDIFSSIIHGFALPIKAEHQDFLKNVLIPLHKAKELEMFQQHLAECVIQFIYKDCRMGPLVINGLLKYWPVMIPLKETLFLDELQDAIGEMMNATDFEMETLQPLIIPIFTRIAKCIESLNYTVGERALTMWNSDFIRWLCSELREIIFPIIAPALLRNVKNHWSENVQSLSEDVIDVFKDQDALLWEQTEKKWRESDEDKVLKTKRARRKKKYEYLKKVAQQKLKAQTG